MPSGIRGAAANLSQTRPIVLLWAISVPLVEIGLTVTRNLGKARALEVAFGITDKMMLQLQLKKFSSSQNIFFLVFEKGT